MTTDRWDPLQDLLSLHEKMNRLFEDSFAKGLENQYFTCGTWTPPIDIFETENHFSLKAELPGIDEVVWASAAVTHAHLTPIGRTEDGQPRFWCKAGLRVVDASRAERTMLVTDAMPTVGTCTAMM